MPELACGEFEEFVSHALQFAHTEVLKLCDGLPAEEKIFVIEEFEDGRGSLVFTIRLKITSTYSRIPNSLGCLGHKDESKARHFLILSRQQFDALTPVMKSKAHFLTLLVFSTDNIIGREAEEFMRGKPRNDCSHLLILAVLFLMMSTAERAGERPHALVARALKNSPNAGMAVLSGSLGRNQEIQRFLHHNPKNILKFEEQMSLVYHPAMAAKELGIANHPDLENNLYYEELLGLHKSRAAEPMDMEDDAGVLGGGQLALERVSKRAPVFRLAESFVWGCVTFKYRSPTGTNKFQQGYQVDCPRASHRVKRKNGAFMLKTLFVDL